MARSRSLALASLVVLVVGVGVGSVAVSGQMPDGQQRLAMVAKPAVVRIWSGFAADFFGPTEQAPGADAVAPSRRTVRYIGSGSGFFINAGGYVATNAHVTDLTHGFDQGGESYAVDVLYKKLCRDLLKKNCQREEISATRNAWKYEPRSFVHVHDVVIANGSRFPFEIKSFGRPVGQGKDVAIIKIEVQNAPALKIDESRGPELQDHVTVFGYPDAAESQVLAKPASLEVTITDGRVSARKTMTDAAPVLQISAAASYGNSGGPVLNDAGQVIGLLTFAGDSAQEVTGFEFVVPSSTVLEFVRTAGATNTLGDIDKRYEEGLNFFWQGQKEDAIRKFEEVRRLFPHHSEVTALISRTEGLPTSPVQEPGFSWRPVMIVAIAVLALGGIGMLFMKRQRPAAASSETTRVPAGGGPSRPTSSPAVSRPVAASTVSDEEDATVRSGFTPSLGAITCVSGPLSGQRFEIPQEGIYIGRDASLSQVVIDDARVSKRHVWIGPRQGRMMAVDQASTNGTFLNNPGGESIREVFLKPGEAIIVSEPEVGQFVYKR